MILSHVIDTVFGTPARVAILRRLAAAPQPLSGRQLAELTGLSHRGAIQAVKTLADIGVVKQRQAGNAYQYTLAEENVIVLSIILPALRAEGQLSQTLKQELVGLFAEFSVSLVLFGSFARGEENALSDVDLFAVAASNEKKRAILESAERNAAAFQERFSALLSVYALTQAELQSRAHTDIINSIKRDGILLSGKALNDLFGLSA